MEPVLTDQDCARYLAHPGGGDVIARARARKVRRAEKAKKKALKSQKRAKAAGADIVTDPNGGFAMSITDDIRAGIRRRPETGPLALAETREQESARLDRELGLDGADDDDNDIDVELADDNESHNKGTPALKNSGGLWSPGVKATDGTSAYAAVAGSQVSALLQKLRAHPDVQATALPGADGSVTCCVNALSDSGRMHSEKVFSESGGAWPTGIKDDAAGGKYTGENTQ